MNEKKFVSKTRLRTSKQHTDDRQTETGKQRMTAALSCRKQAESKRYNLQNGRQNGRHLVVTVTC